MSYSDRSLSPNELGGHEATGIVRRLRRSLQTDFWLVTPALLFILLIFIIPLGNIVLLALNMPHFSLHAFAQLFTDWLYIKVILNTFEISGIAMLVAALTGYPLAYLINRSSKNIRLMLYAAVILSFWVSMIVRSFAWIELLNRHGVVADVFGLIGLSSLKTSLLYNKFSVIVGMANVLLPFMILPVLGAMDAIDDNLLRAAETLGAKPSQVFWRIFFPLSRPGLGAGGLLVFILAIGFYITPALLGGPHSIMVSQLVSTEINRELNWPIAGALATLLLGITIGGVAVFNYFLGLDKLFK